MQEIITSILIPFLTAFGAGFITWLFARNRNSADTKSVQIDNEIKSATYYQNLLDDMSKRLEESIVAIEKRDVRIKDRDDKIEKLINEIGQLTDELRKYKQLNGKEH
jgi:cell division protein FtsX